MDFFLPRMEGWDGISGMKVHPCLVIKYLYLSMYIDMIVMYVM